MKKIIITSVVIGLVLILGISTLVLALIPVGINDKIEKPNEIYITSSLTTSFPDKALTFRDRDEEDRDEISNIYSLFSHAFEQKMLSALFNKELNKGIDASYSKKSDYLSKNTSTEDKITVVFKYTNSQPITAGEKSSTYKYLFFEITPKNERAEVVMGVSSNITISNTSYYYNYSLVGKANFSEMIKHVNSLI